MPTRPRLVIPELPLHITQRGVNRGPTFLDNEDFGFYLWVLRVAGAATGCRVHAYVLMTNHVHLLVTPGEVDAPANLMRSLNGRYVRYFNDRYWRTGTLWEGRFRSMLIDTERYFFSCSRYIETNPVRAGLADDPDVYPWSSFRCNALGAVDAILTAHPLYAALGTDKETRTRAYQSLFAAELSGPVLAAIRTAPVSRRSMPANCYQEAVDAFAAASSHRTGPSAVAGTRVVRCRSG